MLISKNKGQNKSFRRFYASFPRFVKIIFYSSILLLSAPWSVYAAGVIGVDTTFQINTVNFLTSNPEYAQAFNYFFTIEMFVGLLAFWIRITVRSMRF